MRCTWPVWRDVVAVGSAPRVGAKKKEPRAPKAASSTHKQATCRHAPQPTHSRPPPLRRAAALTWVQIWHLLHRLWWQAEALLPVGARSKPAAHAHEARTRQLQLAHSLGGSVAHRLDELVAGPAGATCDSRRCACSASGGGGGGRDGVIVTL
jgi:hypothetical protein